MPYFLNGNFKNNEFKLVSKDKFFVDKTKLIEDINNLIGIKDRFICITRPRRQNNKCHDACLLLL